MKRLAIFASGNGSNAENIIQYFKGNTDVKIVVVFTNNSKAKVIERAINHSVPYEVFSRQELNDEIAFLLKLNSYQPDFIILAGFLLKIPDYLIHRFPNKIINIHPSLLPKYGGKGMYGAHVHEAVVAAKENKSGITIHFVNENYDEGAIIAQYECQVSSSDDSASLAAKIHQLEQNHFPQVIESILNN